MIEALGVGLAFAIIIDKLIDERPDFKKQMVSTISNFPSTKYSDIVKKSNEIFIQLFNILYTNKSKNEFFWSWIFSSFCLIFLFGLFLQIYQITPPLENLLVFNVVLSSYIIVYGFFFDLVEENVKSESKTKIITIFSGFLLSGGIFYIFIYNILNKIYVIPDNIDIYLLLAIIIIGLSIGLLYIELLYGRKSVLLYKSPIRVAITSILAMSTITLLKKDILTSFISHYNEIGIIVLAYLFLNIFADSISLLETDIVLRLAAKGNIKRFAALGLFDIFLSAFIFLAIPLSTGNLDMFLDAMLFKGEHPWLGVLFWSTFSTSIIFWLFLLSVFVLTILQKILKLYVKLSVALPIDKKPITCLYVTAVVFIILPMFVINLIF